MLSFTPILRLRCSAVNIKNVIRATNENYVRNLSSSRINLKKNVYSFNSLRKLSTKSSSKEVDVSQEPDAPGELTTFQAIKENSKTLWYGSIMLAGLSLAGAIFYVLLKELFSGNSPNNIFSKAYEKCIKDEKVIFSLGEPIKGHGEENRRRRARHVSHVEYEKDGVKYMKMRFYLKGSRRNGTAYLEMQQNEKGNYEFRYLVVQVTEYPHTLITVEDNTHIKPLAPVTTSDLSPQLL